MKVIKKIVSIALTLVALSSSIFAAEWGGVFKNGSKISLPAFTDFGFRQTNDLYLWLNSPLGDSGVYFSGEGMYEFTYSKGKENSAVTNIADVDLFKFSGDYEINEATLSFSAGRFSVSDSTSAIFTQNIDGAAVKYSASLFRISAWAGYTGLLNSNNITMIDGNAAAYAPETKVYSLSNGFIPLNATVEFPVLLGNQSLSIQANGFIDLGKSKTSRYYGTLMVSGPITNSIFYDVASSIGSANFSNVMNYTTFNFYYYPLDMFFVSCGLEYATKNFTGITSRAVVSSVSAPETKAMILPKLSATLLFDNFVASLNGKFLISTPETGTKASGVEADLSVAYNVFSDLQFGLDVTSYFDVAGIKEDNNFSATLKVAVSF